MKNVKHGSTRAIKLGHHTALNPNKNPSLSLSIKNPIFFVVNLGRNRLLAHMIRRFLSSNHHRNPHHRRKLAGILTIAAAATAAGGATISSSSAFFSDQRPLDSTNCRKPRASESTISFFPNASLSVSTPLRQFLSQLWNPNPAGLRTLRVSLLSISTMMQFLGLFCKFIRKNVTPGKYSI